MKLKEVENIVVEKTKYTVICDICGTYLGSYEPYEDGYWSNPHEVKDNVDIFGERFILRRDLCTQCQKTMRANIEKKVLPALKKIGYKTEAEADYDDD